MNNEHTGGFASPINGLTTADAPYTPTTGTRSTWGRSDEPCKPDGPDPYPNEYKRWRDGSKKRENKTKNRKAAKAARKARKVNR